MFKRLKPEFWAALIAAFLATLAVQAFAQEETPAKQRYTPEQAQVVRQYLLDILDKGDASLDELIAKIRNGTVADYSKDTRSTGLYLLTKTLDEQEKIRHTIVGRVFPYSPADRAGIKPGDRLLKIGDEELDHESGKAVRLYLSQYDSEVPVTVVRPGGSTSETTLAFEPIPCFADVLRTFRADEYLRKFAYSRNQSSRIRGALTKEGLNDLNAKALVLAMQVLADTVAQDVAEMQAELDPGLHPACASK